MVSLPARDETRLLRWASLSLLAAVWLIGLLPVPANFGWGLALGYSAVLAGLMLAELLSPLAEAPSWLRAAWVGLEVVLAFLAIRVSGGLTRPSLLYLLPASRALLLFGPRAGLGFGLLGWIGFAANTYLYLGHNRLGEVPSYVTFLLAPYVLAVVLTLAVLRQAEDRRQLQALYDELSAAHAELRQLHAQAEEAAVNRERNRLAREIHDSVAHYLTIVNLQLEAVEKLGAGQPERAVAEAKRARRLTVECLQEVRRSVAALRSATLEELSLPGALRKLVTEFRDNTGMDVQLDTSLAEDMAVSPEARLALYRAAQEGLTNVQRHAQASQARVVLSRHNGTAALSVEDDGIGPDTPSPSPAAAEAGRVRVYTARGSLNAAGESPHLASPITMGEGHARAPAVAGFGLLGLRERVALLGGELDFGPGAQGGAKLTVTVPVHTPELVAAK
ncbi:MAG: sensor histidine kinase [Chloroflexi bacterium]|nr:sensor histidine kinase [Chloroflexota bacterium]